MKLRGFLSPTPKNNAPDLLGIFTYAFALVTEDMAQHLGVDLIQLRSVYIKAGGEQWKNSSVQELKEFLVTNFPKNSNTGDFDGN